MRFISVWMLALGAMTLAVTPAIAGEHEEKKEQKEYQCDKEKKRHKRPSFSEIDNDGDGSISQDEFIAAHIEKLERKFRHIDEDESGGLSEDELAEHHEKMKKKWRNKSEQHKKGKR